MIRNSFTNRVKRVKDGASLDSLTAPTEGSHVVNCLSSQRSQEEYKVYQKEADAVTKTLLHKMH